MRLKWKIVILSLAALSLLALLGRAWWRHQEAQLPDLGQLEDDAWVIQRLGLKSWAPLESVAPIAVAAVLASEDDRFFEHQGVDTKEAWQALRSDLKALRYKRGASTLSMQVARNVYLSKRKTLGRKAQEVMLTTRLEQEYTKQRILEVYLNIAEWGPHKERGISEAARIYFGKPPAELNAKEACFLAMLLPSPARYSESFTARKLTRYAKRRVSQLLGLLEKEGLLEEGQAALMMGQPLAFEAR